MMAARRFNWSLWPLKQDGGNRNEEVLVPSDDEQPLPWVLLSAKPKETNKAAEQLYAAQDEHAASMNADGVVGERRGVKNARSVMHPTGAKSITNEVQGENRPRWLSELESPYGISDEDGTLKEIDSVNWRRVVRVKRPKARRFVPRTRNKPAGRTGEPVHTGFGETRARWQNDDQENRRRQSQGTGIRTSAGGSSAGSTWMLQLGGAIVLALVGLYAHNASTPLATNIRTVYQKAFSSDYTQSAAPAISQFLKSHNIAVPAFLTNAGAMKLHVPLQGTIAEDYSSTHPQMAIVGTPGEAVLAAGSGTVSRVVKLQSGIMVVIDHGTLGNSFYFGLGTTSVKTGESVASGQVIGKLPTNSKNPKLMFELEQGGKAVNPHQYIVFSSTAGTT